MDYEVATRYPTLEKSASSGTAMSATAANAPDAVKSAVDGVVADCVRGGDLPETIEVMGILCEREEAAEHTSPDVLRSRWRLLSRYRREFDAYQQEGVEDKVLEVLGGLIDDVLFRTGQQLIQSGFVSEEEFAEFWESIPLD